jgi:hypothetical protein
MPWPSHFSNANKIIMARGMSAAKGANTVMGCVSSALMQQDQNPFAH